jgi:hypothetical protein
VPLDAPEESLDAPEERPDVLVAWQQPGPAAEQSWVLPQVQRLQASQLLGEEVELPILVLVRLRLPQAALQGGSARLQPEWATVE